MHRERRDRKGRRDEGGWSRTSRPAGTPSRYRTATSLNPVSSRIIEESIRIHRDLGPALAESVYERVLQRALLRCGLTVERQLCCDFEYDGMLFRRAIRLDLFVEGSIAVELKAERQAERENPRQHLSQLKLLNLPLCLLINFGLPRLNQGIQRLVNGMEE